LFIFLPLETEHKGRWGALQHCWTTPLVPMTRAGNAPRYSLRRLIQESTEDGTYGARSPKLRVTAATVAHDDCCPRRQLAGWLAALLICLAYSSAALFNPRAPGRGCHRVSSSGWCYCGVPRRGSVTKLCCGSFQVVMLLGPARW